MLELNCSFLVGLYVCITCLSQCPTEWHEIALEAAAPSRQTLLLLGKFMSYNTLSGPTSFDACGDLHSQNVLP